ncbi:hypothetical protein SUNI508_06121 [Seiridium unicorne]|uniref:Uncharacterized protein n=1 Tax=Seiridium unicorne TaxID=138068 RepID=A0ABR2V291_9PEZI
MSTPNTSAAIGTHQSQESITSCLGLSFLLLLLLLIGITTTIPGMDLFLVADIVVFSILILLILYLYAEGVCFMILKHPRVSLVILSAQTLLGGSPEDILISAASTLFHIYLYIQSTEFILWIGGKLSRLLLLIE